MNDKISNIPLDDERPGGMDGVGGAGAGGDTGAGNGCGLQENQFPRPGKCFNESRSISGIVFQQTCPYCSIWTSLPEGADLVVAHLLECSLYGYVKRVKE